MRLPKVWSLAGAVLMAGAFVPLGGLGQSVSAANSPGPTLTVVGYGLVNMTPSSSNPGPQQIQINIQEQGTSGPAVLRALSHDLAKLKTQMEKVGASASDITIQQAPNLNISNGGGFNANETIEVNFPTLMQLAKAYTASGAANDVFVQNAFIIPANSPGLVASAAGLTAGYQAAFANAEQTAQAMAQADNLQLGQSVSITEGGSSNNGCSAMGGCYAPPAGNPPQVGPNQELVTVTVT